VLTLGLRQRADHIAQGGQAQVDLRRLPQLLAHRIRFRLPLAAGQVHKTQLALGEQLAAVDKRLGAFDGDGEDGVRTAGLLVHRRLARVSLKNEDLVSRLFL
jgi:hypothetical protein